jgi:hypothetical protein
VVLPRLITNFKDLDTTAQKTLTTTLGGQRQFAAVTALLNNSEAVGRALDAASTAAGATESRINAIMSNLAGEIQRFKISLQAAVMNVMQSGLLDWLGAVLVGFNKILGVTNNLLSRFNNLGATIARLPGVPDWVGELTSVVTKLGMALVGFRLVAGLVAPMRSQLLARVARGAEEANIATPAYIRTTPQAQGGMAVVRGNTYSFTGDPLRRYLAGEAAAQTAAAAPGVRGFIRSGGTYLAPLQYGAGGLGAALSRMGETNVPVFSRALTAASVKLGVFSNALSERRLDKATATGGFGASLLGNLGITAAISAAFWAVSKAFSTASQNAETMRLEGEKLSTGIPPDMEQRLAKGQAQMFTRTSSETGYTGRYSEQLSGADLIAAYRKDLETGLIASPFISPDATAQQRSLAMASEAARLANQRTTLPDRSMEDAAKKAQELGISVDQVREAMSMSSGGFETYKKDLVEQARSAGATADQIKGLTKQLDELYKSVGGAQEGTVTTKALRVEQSGFLSGNTAGLPDWVLEDRDVKDAIAAREKVVGGFWNTVNNWVTEAKPGNRDTARQEAIDQSNKQFESDMTAANAKTSTVDRNQATARAQEAQDRRNEEIAKDFTTTKQLEKAQGEYANSLNKIEKNTSMTAAQRRGAVKDATDTYRTEVKRIYNEVANDDAERSQVAEEGKAYEVAMRKNTENAMAGMKTFNMFGQVTAEAVNSTVAAARAIFDLNSPVLGDAIGTLVNSLPGASGSQLASRLRALGTQTQVNSDGSVRSTIDYNAGLQDLLEIQLAGVNRLEEELNVNPEDDQKRQDLLSAMQAVNSTQKEMTDNVVEDAKFRAQEAIDGGNYEEGKRELLSAIAQIRVKMAQLSKSDPEYRRLAATDKDLRRQLAAAIWGPEKQRLLDQLAKGGSASQMQSVRAELMGVEAKITDTDVGDEAIEKMLNEQRKYLISQQVQKAIENERLALMSQESSADEKAMAASAIKDMLAAEAAGKFEPEEGESFEHLWWRINHFKKWLALKAAKEAVRTAQAAMYAVLGHAGTAAAQRKAIQAGNELDAIQGLFDSDTPPSFSGPAVSTGPAFSNSERANAKASAAQARQAAAKQAKDMQAAIDAAMAQYEMAKALQDSVTQTQMKINENLRKQAAARAKGREGLAELYGLMAEEVTLRRDLERAYMDRANAELELANAIDNAAGRSVDAARRSVVIAQSKLAQAIKVYGSGSAEALAAQGEVVSAEAAARDAYLQQRLDDIDFAREFNEMTSAEAIRELNAILLEKDLTEQQRRDIMRRIRGIEGEMSGQFNISEIRLPTPYEVRRYIQAAKQRMGYLAAGEGAETVAGAHVIANGFKSSVGSFASSTAAFASAVDRINTTRSESSGPTSVTINVNGDPQMMQQVIDQYFGQLVVPTAGGAVTR